MMITFVIYEASIHFGGSFKWKSIHPLRSSIWSFWSTDFVEVNFSMRNGGGVGCDEPMHRADEDHFHVFLKRSKGRSVLSEVATRRLPSI